MRVRDLCAISPSSKGNLAPRDCAEIAHPHPGHLEALPSGVARRACHGGIGNGGVRSDSTKWPSMVVTGAWVHLGAFCRFGKFWRVCANCRKSPSNTHASTPPPYSTTLSNRNKPGHSQHPRGVLRALRHSVGPVGDQAAAAQSRRNLAIQYLAISRDSEIVPRLCRCILVTYRSD